MKRNYITKGDVAINEASNIHPHYVQSTDEKL